MNHDELRAHVQELNESAFAAGGKARVDRQHASGKLTARERLDLLFDADTFIEIDRFRTHRCQDFGMEEKKILGDGVIVGYGLVDGRQVFAYSQDATIFGGALSEVVSQKICKVFDLAIKNGSPFVGICDSGGARIQEGVASLAAYSEIFYRNTIASGVIPQISVIMGPCAGGAVYSPALTDFIFMVEKKSFMFLTGPDVIKTVTHENVSMEELGGAYTHNHKSGVAHFAYPSDEAALVSVRELLGYLPANNSEFAKLVETTDDPNREDELLKTIIPTASNKPYDVREVIELLVDDKHFLEVQSEYAQNIVIGFASFNGQSVGIVANQPQVLAGAIDINASDKASRFVRTCDCFNVPVITLVDVPGFLPGTGQEYGGVIRHGAKMLYAYSEATVPLITIILRKAYGGAFCVMGSKELRSDLNYALPTAEIAVMGAQGAVQILNRQELKAANDHADALNKFAGEYREKFENPFIAADRGFIDEIILPEKMRQRICSGLSLLKNKRESHPPKKHGNIPL